MKHLRRIWGSHTGSYGVQRRVVRFSQPTFRRNISQVASRAQLTTWFKLASCLAYTSILKVEARSSETSVDFQRITRRYITKERTLRTSQFLMTMIMKINIFWDVTPFSLVDLKATCWRKPLFLFPVQRSILHSFIHQWLYSPLLGSGLLFGSVIFLHRR
jgi:predicted membrane protein